MPARFDGFDEKVAIVTGGASGIGLAIGTALAGRGAHVVLADIDGEAAERAAKDLDDSGTVVTGAALDVRDGDAVAALVTETAESHGHLDIMVNNAGVVVGGEVQDLTLEHWDHIIDVNVKGVVHGVAAAYPLMVEQGSGHIVNTASVAGLVPTPLMAPYSTTKHAVVGLSQSLRCEAAGHGVSVHCVCPGPVDTPLLERLVPDGLPVPKHVFSSTRDFLTSMVGPAYAPEDLAADVLRAIELDRGLVVVPRFSSFTWLMSRFSPWLAVRIGQQVVAKTRAAYSS